MSKIGILTFHKVYNYGAAIQAYALQSFLENSGYAVEIIDFIKIKQKDYTNVISIHNGLKRFLKTIMLFTVLKERIGRKKRFDDFFERQLIISNQRYLNENSLIKANEKYDTFIVGSDQVWNTRKESDFSSAYLLDFVQDEKKKIAYAPSIGIADKKDLMIYKELLQRFDVLSCREVGGARILQEITGKEVKSVLDPTLLVSRESLEALTRKIHNEPYILYYSLDGYDKKKRNMDILEYLRDRYSLEVRIITPEWPFHKNYGKDVRNAGPKEFLSLIKYASLVCTNSFHGTALSLKFEKPLYVLEDKGIKDERKRSILKQVGALDRLISCVDDLKEKDGYDMDYRTIKDKMGLLERESRDYLINALKGEA